MGGLIFPKLLHCEMNGVSSGLLKKATKKYVMPILPHYVAKGASKDCLISAHMYTKESPALYRIINGGLRSGDAKVLDKVQVLFNGLMEVRH